MTIRYATFTNMRYNEGTILKFGTEYTMIALKKTGKIALFVFGGLLALVLLVWLVLFFGKYLLYRDFFAHREKEFQIPGIHDGYVPQGLANVDEEGSAFVLSGYNGKDLALYYHDVKTNTSKCLIPVDEDGKIIEGHGGGLTVCKDYVYVSENDALYTFYLSEIRAAEDGGKVTCHAIIPVDNQSSFCFVEENFLYVGEFYRPVVYETDPSHIYTTPAGEEHRAIVSCYLLNDDGSLAEQYPIYSISIPSQVQGFAIKDNTIMLSRSWGLEQSVLEFYEGMRDSGTTISVSGREVPLYYLDSTNLKKEVQLPCFSEELCVVGDRVYISFESACNKYVVGKFFFATYIASYPIGE